MIKFNWRTKVCAALPLWAIAAAALPAQNFRTLHNFNGVDGADALAGLVQGTDGNLYGTTISGGGTNDGTVFKITADGTLTTLYSFCSQSACTDGASPAAGLMQGADGKFYGTTQSGGASDDGTVFKITTAGTLTTLYSFCSQSGIDCTDGAAPEGGLVQGTDGKFYGTTFYGGTNFDGTVFKISPSGAQTVLHRFCSQTDCKDGKMPFAGLVQGTDGNFYGTTSGGGGNCNGTGGSCGTVFKITPRGALTTLHTFDFADGQYPYAALIQATDGNFYGMTLQGGANNFCDQNCGTAFSVTASGGLTTLYNFCSQGGGSCTDGASPYAGLIQGTDGNFYGATAVGGLAGQGALFQLSANGTYTGLHSFTSSAGGEPPAGLIQDTNGMFYGTASSGGTFGDGTIYSLSVGLAPFVEAQPTSGAIGAAVKILGTRLTGATSITFNGTAATFIVKSKSEITTTVPTGATTGPVQAVTPGGTLSSNVPFRVRP